MTESTTEAKPCVVCGTTGGYTRPGKTRASRSRGACESCYRSYRTQGRVDELDRVHIDAQAFLQRLLAGDVEPDEGGCILWPGYTRMGYGRIYTPDSDQYAQEVTHIVLEHFVGPRPSPEHDAAHAPHDVCGNRGCVNVEHLRWATRMENMHDKFRDGTAFRGESSPVAKLTEDDVHAIRRLYDQRRLTRQQIADRFGVTGSTVYSIAKRNSWKHLGDEDATADSDAA